jgi:5'-nucleotidase (lipoprotein e(P4) family)
MKEMKNNFLLCLLLFTVTSCSTERSNYTTNSVTELKTNSQDHLTMATLWYQRSGEMRALYYQAFNLARMTVEQHLLLSSNSKQAVVLDIDETVLDNSPFQAEMILQNNAYNADLWYQWTQQALAKSLPGALEFCQYLFEKKIEIFYISNRSVSELESTLKNLTELGFPFSDPEHVILKDRVSSKKFRRQKVTDNFDIILLIGDNLDDFSEIFEDRSDNYGLNIVDQHASDFGDRYIILPNPMYGSWESAISQHLNDTDLSEKQTRWKQLLKGYSSIH